MYQTKYFSSLRSTSLTSAKTIVPIILELIDVSSVLDLGCGTGVWLSVFRENGISEVLGVDGSYVDRSTLEIPENRFVAADLNKPFDEGRRFDLAISVEVAEHLNPASGQIFVDSLTRHADVILFSAAIPFQGGHHHINEQWPEFWKAHFAEKGFQLIDCLRTKIWDNKHVAWWYAQNLVIFANKKGLASSPGLKKVADSDCQKPLNLVHPERYLELARLERKYSREIWSSRTVLAGHDLLAHTNMKDKILWIDEHKLPDISAGDRELSNFPPVIKEGALTPSQLAIDILENEIKQGAQFLAFAWPTFWWLDYYTHFGEYLNKKFSLVLKNERIILYSLG